jgi:hypothetical protein
VLSVVTPSVVTPSIIMASVVMQNVTMLSVVMLSVVVLCTEITKHSVGKVSDVKMFFEQKSGRLPSSVSHSCFNKDEKGEVFFCLHVLIHLNMRPIREY